VAGLSQAAVAADNRLVPTARFDEATVVKLYALISHGGEGILDDVSPGLIAARIDGHCSGLQHLRMGHSLDRSRQSV
jgi:hypothetical protein